MRVLHMDDAAGVMLVRVVLGGEDRMVEFRRVSGPSERGISTYRSADLFAASSADGAGSHVVAMTAMRTNRGHALSLGFPADCILPLADGDVLCLSHVAQVGRRTDAQIVGWADGDTGGHRAPPPSAFA